MRAINLLPKDAERARRTAPDPALLVGVIGFGVVVAALFFMYNSASSKVLDKQSQRDALKVTLAQQARVNPPPKVLPIQASISGIEAERIGATASALSYRVPWDYILGQIAIALPPGVKLTTLSATTPVSPNPQFVAATGTTNLQLGGWTYAQESVAQFMTRLQLLPPLVRKSITLNSSTINSGTSGHPYFQFAISAQIRAPGVTP